MPTCFAAIETDNASKYLMQLCKHFAHKVDVDYDSAQARVEFPPGRCMMTAEGAILSFYCRSREEEGIAVMQHILSDHLTRFAWREEIAFDWDARFPEPLPEAVRLGFAES
ncbi:MAG: 2,4-dihydroxyhept-2-ene-1,7-dioic acid aldolase [Rhodospirillaceae bacterium]|nr:2,4-dihydroxyhept-2-ene-1,7-dioic acid aldolase [Rhodospirillaceae bacterium]|tara:strand:+ start:367 stop:699 length:333 start_codon:yes stop_codon:yes gene_type:complete